MRPLLALSLLLLSAVAHANGRAPARPPRRDPIYHVLNSPHAVSGQPYSQLRRSIQVAAGPERWSEFKKLNWQPFPLRERWIGEEKPGFVSKGTVRREVAYLTKAQRAKYRVTIGADGKLYDAKGKPFSCAPNSLLVADTDGNLYARDSAEIAREAADESRPAFAHSSFLAGGDSPMSIEIHAKDGVALEFKNRSGHYRPNRRAFVSWLVGLEQNGLDMSGARVSFDPKSTVDEE